MVGLGIAAALGLTGCSAGQITETDTQLPAVNGALGQAGTISLRNIQLAYPPNGSYPQGGKATITGTIVNDGQTQDELIGLTAPVATEISVKGEPLLPPRRVLTVEKGFEIASSTTSAPHSSASSSVTPTQTPSSEAPASSESSVPSTSSVATTSSEAPAGASQSGAAGPTLPTVSTTTQTSIPLDRGEIVITLDGLKEPVHSGKTIPITFIFRHGGSVTLAVPVAVPTEPRGEQAGGH